jgi:hypothetical protein
MGYYGLAEEEEPTHCVVLRAGGLLSVLDMERGSEVRVLLFVCQCV